MKASELIEKLKLEMKSSGKDPEIRSDSAPVTGISTDYKSNRINLILGLGEKHV